MERPVTTAEGPALPRWAWLLGVLALLTWHGWLTFSLFGADPWQNLCNDQPIVSGVHPQKQYIGSVAALGIASQGRTSVYDHRFQTGYPLTPIFDGSRLAELFFLLGGGTYQPAAYKIGFAVVCFIVPLFLLITCKAVGLGHGTSLLATLLGELIWWGPHGRSAVIGGDCELYLAALAGLAHVGFLIAFHRTASVRSWFGLWITACIGWFLQPLLFPIALPVLLAYYLSVGTKHDFLTWHFAFWGVELLAVAVHLPWLIDWLDSWWLRTPLPLAADLLAHRTIQTVWEAPLWGGASSRMLAMFLFGSAAGGVAILNQTGDRPSARLLGGAALGALVLAVLGISWEPIGAMGTTALLAPALWFACIPAAHAWVWITKRLWRFGLVGRVLLGILVSGEVSAYCLCTENPATLLDRCTPGAPLEIGLNAERQAIVQLLRSQTSDDARILWEDRKTNRQTSRWPALLPILTERSYIGGLDPDGFIEHSSISLLQLKLDNNAIADGWSDEELLEYCRRYNVRWIVAWSPAALERFSKWPATKKHTQLSDEGEGWLFEVERTPNFALKGHAELLEANGRYIMLKNVVPHQGEVVISLHYQNGMRASLPRVQVEKAGSADDSIGFVRLVLAVEAKHLTLTWER
jgi:hypothetical protein